MKRYIHEITMHETDEGYVIEVTGDKTKLQPFFERSMATGFRHGPGFRKPGISCPYTRRNEAKRKP